MWKLPVLLILVAALQGVVRRDDVPDSEYLRFGKDGRFDPIGIVMSGIGNATGTLIDPYTVLTVAHIAPHGGLVQFRIENPSNHISHCVNGSAQIHEGFYFTQNDQGVVLEIHNDIALIHLSSPIHFVRPVLLDYDTKRMGLFFISAGFGASGTGSSGPTFLDFKKRGFTNFIPEIWHTPLGAECFPSLLDRPGSPWQTRLEGLGARGDSGSPTFTEMDGNFLLFGMIHLLSGTGTYGSYNIIVPIALYRDWIETNRH